MREVREYTWGDKDRLPDVLEPHVQIDSLQDARIMQNPAWTMTMDEEPIACGGAWIMWPGVCTGWILISSKAAEHHISLVKAVWEHRNLLLTEHGMHRIQAAVDPHFDAAISLIERLGFEAEGVLRQYTRDGRNQILYSYINKELL